MDSFRADERTIDAVLRNLQVIGEAAKKLPNDVRAAMSDIDWKRIAGLRDIVTHEYFAVDADIVWDIVENKVPVLESRVRQYLAQ